MLTRSSLKRHSTTSRVSQAWVRTCSERWNEHSTRFRRTPRLPENRKESAAEALMAVPLQSGIRGLSRTNSNRSVRSPEAATFLLAKAASDRSRTGRPNQAMNPDASASFASGYGPVAGAPRPAFVASAHRLRSVPSHIRVTALTLLVLPGLLDAVRRFTPQSTRAPAVVSASKSRARMWSLWTSLGSSK